ncbi:MAG: YHS domain-containing protein [Deltaproteobacteria bacterium]|nr:YHS domain-containing protein [Deltaproteobacteria bacterium]
MTMGTLIWIVLIGGAIFMMMRKGGGGCCGGGHDHGGHDHSGGGQTSEHDGGGMDHHEGHKEQIVELKDPVCGMTVKDSSIAHEHEGTSYSFCSEHCREKFVANPAEFIK